MTGTRNPEQERHFSDLYLDGWTMQQIADRSGYSKQRVHQVLRLAGVPGRGNTFEPATVMATVRLPHIRSLRDLAKAVGARGTSTVYEIVLLAGADEAVVRLFAWRRRKFTQQKYLRAIRALAEEVGGTPTATQLSVAKIFPEKLCRAFGSVRNALLAAGLTPRPQGHPPKHRDPQ